MTATACLGVFRKQIYVQRVCWACTAVHPFTFEMSNFLLVLSDQMFANFLKFLAKRKDNFFYP